MLTKKVKILFEPASCGLSHLMRCLSLAQGLKKQGFTVGFALKSTLVNMVRKYGYSDVYAITDEYDNPIDYFERLKILCSMQHIKKCLQDEQRIINRFKPDLVISDFRLTSGISAEMSGIPWGSFIHSFEPLSGRKIVEKTLHRAGLVDFSIDKINKILKMHAKNFHPFLGKTKFSPETDIWEFLISPYFSFLPCVPSISKLSGREKNIHYVGPVAASLNANITCGSEINNFIKRVKNMNAPLVYVRMNFVSKKYKNVIKKIIQMLCDIFDGSSIHMIISTSMSIQKKYSSNIKIASFIPKNLIMRLNNVVVVGTGSHTTSLETVAHGLPLLIFPFGFERMLNAQRLKESGAGEWLSPEQVNRKKIKKLIEQLFYDMSYKKAAKKQQTIIRRYRGIQTALEYTKEYVESIV